MTWTLLGIGRDNATSIEFPMPPEFTDETARQWFGPDKNLRRRTWALDPDQVAAVTGMLADSLPAEAADYWLTYGTLWVVEAYNQDDDSLALAFHLPPGFGFANAARWTGHWSIDVFSGEFPLETEQLEELSAIFGVQVDTDRYAYVLGARPAAPTTITEGEA